MREPTEVIANDVCTVRNQVLNSMAREDFSRLYPLLERIPLLRNKLISDANRRPASVYFPESGIISRLATTSVDAPVEVALVGRFGLVGISVVLGTSETLNRTVVLAPGEAYRISAEQLRDVMDAHPGIKVHLLRYVQALIGLKAQLTLCNARHSVDQRIARWLLMVHDRMDSDDLPVTHELIARALGARRPGITDALTSLEAAGIISKMRAVVRICDRDRLLQRSCGCYDIIDRRFARNRSRSAAPDLMSCAG